MAEITPLPKDFGEDLNALKVLADERQVKIEENDKSVQVINIESDQLRGEVKLIQDEILIILGLKSRKEKEGVVVMEDTVATVEIGGEKQVISTKPAEEKK